MENYTHGGGGFDQKTVVAPRLRCDGGMIKTMFLPFAAMPPFKVDSTSSKECISINRDLIIK